MYESCDTHGWMETTVPSGFSAFDPTLFGCLRFTSIFPRFPLSIAYPAWSHPVLNIDERGFGSVKFKGAFTMRRMSLPRHVTKPREIREFSIQQLRPRRLVQASLDPVAAIQPGDWQSIPLRADLHD